MGEKLRDKGKEAFLRGIKATGAELAPEVQAMVTAIGDEFRKLYKMQVLMSKLVKFPKNERVSHQISPGLHKQCLE